MTWVERDPRVGVGARITLKDHADPKIVWDVVEMGSSHASTDIKRGWNNNI